MAANRWLTIHFMDGTKLNITFPKQVTDVHQMAQKIQKALDARQLAFALDDEMIIVPIDNIKYMQVHPVAEKLPDSVIRGAKLKL